MFKVSGKRFLMGVTVFAIMVSVLSGCANSLTSSFEDDVAEFNNERAAYQQNLNYNVIYTRSLSYIPHPEYYSHICLFSLKLTDGKGGVDKSKFLSRFPESELKNFKSKTGYKGKLMLCVGSDAEQAAYIYKSVVYDADGFINNIINNYLVKYNLDGVDLDWEYFESDFSKNSEFKGYTYSQFNSKYNEFVPKMKKALAAKGYAFTVATPDTSSFVKANKSAMEQADFINVMCYSPDSFSDAKKGMNYYTSAGISKSKLAFGIPFYDEGKSSSEVTTRVKYIRDNGYAGVMAFVADDDKDGKLQKVVYDLIKGGSGSSSGSGSGSSSDSGSSSGSGSSTTTSSYVNFSNVTLIKKSAMSSSAAAGTVATEVSSSTGNHISSISKKSDKQIKLYAGKGRYTIDFYVRLKNAPKGYVPAFNVLTSSNKIAKINKVEFQNDSGSVKTLLDAPATITRFATSTSTFQKISTNHSINDSNGWLHFQFESSSAATTSDYILLDSITFN